MTAFEKLAKWAAELEWEAMLAQQDAARSRAVRARLVRRDAPALRSPKPCIRWRRA